MDVLTLIISGLVGVIIGVLINYLVDVLPKTRRLSLPLCPHCNEPYSLNNYLFSYRCSSCGNRRSYLRIIIVIFTLSNCILLKFYPFANLGFWASLPILIFLGVVLVIDIEHRMVLLEMSLFGIVLFLVYGILRNGFLNALFGGAAGLLIMLGIYLLGFVFSKIIGKLRHKEISEVVFGFGDVMVSTFLGLFAGWPFILGGIFIAMVLFCVFSFLYIITLVITKRYHAFSIAIPFTPFLILGVVVVFYLI